MILDRPMLTIRVVDPEGKQLGTVASYWLPSPGDTLDGYAWPDTLSLGDPVRVVGEVTHRQWLDDGIVVIEVEPS
jgi:hypothetical protein